MPYTYTALVPFYNEGDRVIQTLHILSQVKALTTIIVIDDGSTDAAGKRIQQQFPHITYIRLDHNQGKSAAVMAGASSIKTSHVLLYDADVTGTDAAKINSALEHVRTVPELKMLIFSRQFAPFFSQLIRSHILWSGERVIATDTLIQALHNKPERYQLEAILNNYCCRNKKTIYWTPGDSRNTFKIYKYGFVRGILKDIAMPINILIKTGLMSYIQQLKHLKQISV